MRSRRGLAFAALLVVCAAVGAITVVSAAGRGGGKGDPDAARQAARQLSVDGGGQPMLVFRSLDRKRPATYGHLAFAPLGAMKATVTDRACERLYWAAGRGLCMTAGDLPGTYRGLVLDESLKVLHEIGVGGFPTRTRVSPDGRWGAMTAFVTGHTYNAAGTFSTETQIVDMNSGDSLGSLEDWHVARDGVEITARDRNYWGVTFADDGDTFYATVMTGSHRDLIRGSVRARSATVIHKNVECPSLSPDGTRIAYKKPSAKGWRLHVLDLATGRETPMADTNPRDDQVEWLDDQTLVYGVDEQIWTVPADGSGAPAMWRASGTSPAIVRD